MTLALFITGCEEKIKPSVLDLPNAVLPAQESWNSTVVFSDSGTVRAILKAGHILEYENSKQTLLDSGVHLDFFDADGKHSSVLTAESGKADEGTYNLEAVGNVVVTSDSGVVVRTQRMYWDNKRQKIYSDDFVRITSPKEKLQGTGFESDQNLHNYRIFKVSGSTESQ
ncbi:MAG: LPS export ABC transporter periplasmic protein LptC [Bacteroidota bacterium]|nr:LPS export ABC transporter periplasmic protein LptC [Bacteroidota bacterium]